MSIASVEKFQARSDRNSELSESDKLTMIFVFEELLPEILCHIPTEDLVQWRLVCKRWCQTSDKILSNRSPLNTITFLYDHHAKTYYRPYRKFKTFTIPPNRRMTIFNDLTLNWLSSSNRPFIFTHFEFIGGNLDHEVVQILLCLLGHLVKGLTIEFHLLTCYPYESEHTTSLETFSRVLSIQVPNLESLTIRSLPNEWGCIEEVPPGFLQGGFKHLKNLDIKGLTSFRSYPIFLDRLVQAAGNSKINK